MTKQYVQAGFNPFYPNSIETWKWTTKESPPEWLIDYCRVRNIDLDGKTELEYKKTKSGGVELVLSRTDSYIPILINNPETDSICFDFMSKKLFILTKKELNMLYKEA
jgi:hypothetical protein